MAVSMKTPLMQVVLMGTVFFFVFSAFLTIQAFASDMYGEDLGSKMATALYLSFSFFSFVSPSVTNKLGAKMTMFWGTIGYAGLVAASLVYFENIESSFDFVVILGGISCGLGAALLWTAQGRLIMQYSDGTDNGHLFSIFWALFNMSALVGGLLTFFYFGNSSDSDDDASSTDGSAVLYVVFLSFIVLGALATQMLLPPKVVKAAAAQLAAGGSNSHSDLPLLDKEPEEEDVEEISKENWFSEMAATIAMFRTKRMLFLSLIFFYTGYNQPYQLNTFGNRIFQKQTIGLEMIIFYVSEIIGGLYVGSMLDQSAGNKLDQRKASKKCLLLFFVVTSLSFILCYFQEIGCAFTDSDDADCNTDKDEDKLSYTQLESLRPSIIFALWGFSDSQIQTYSYWLMGTLYDSGVEQARAVGFYKMIQSLGWAIGFALVPQDVMEPIVQMACTTACFLVGLGLALMELP
ncbi:hypothetical protein TrVE_jg11087 [Triparma verrucosa]|uniref:Major facilitator superfamily protein n=2 Tax=Triparma TaxID=722752 RepID=A0A9W7EDR6_9STRA|nr:hypothetical protein TrST_g7094 [Triparma strigata]GMI00705.1 hypothetical protein TrVE_jg11087 [Triparma verrucosa]